jgi:hypothetical protein
MSSPTRRSWRASTRTPQHSVASCGRRRHPGRDEIPSALHNRMRSPRRSRTTGVGYACCCPKTPVGKNWVHPARRQAARRAWCAHAVVCTGGIAQQATHPSSWNTLRQFSGRAMRYTCVAELTGDLGLARIFSESSSTYKKGSADVTSVGQQEEGKGSMGRKPNEPRRDLARLIGSCAALVSALAASYRTLRGW